MKIKLLEQKTKYRVDVITDPSNPIVYKYNDNTGEYTKVPMESLPDKVRKAVIPIDPFSKPDFDSQEWKDQEAKRRQRAYRTETDDEVQTKLNAFRTKINGMDLNDVKATYGKNASTSRLGGDIYKQIYNPRYDKYFGLSEEALKRSLYRFIRQQCKSYKEYKEDTYSKLNKKSDAFGIIKKGERTQQQPITKKPIINVYFDQSGSWNINDVKHGNKIISMLRKFEEEDLLQINIYYFGTRVTRSPFTCGRNTKAQPIVNHILRTKPTNILIMTDSDTRYQDITPVVVPGGCWFMFKNGQVADALIKNIRGARCTQYYNISWEPDDMENEKLPSDDYDVNKKVKDFDPDLDYDGVHEDGEDHRLDDWDTDIY